jgi:hypothetical protein
MKTRYVVLREGTGGWELLDAVDATSAEAAIRLFAEENGDGTYVATPERSWTQRVVKVETQTKVSFGSGS